jgi:Tfp pilus assembly protein PilO
MKSLASVWRLRLWVWLPALVLVVLNLVFLSTYRFLLAGQAQLRAARIERAEKELLDFEADRAALEDLVERANLNRERVDEFYARWVASEAERLTQVIAEVKNLAQRAGVKASSFNYPEEDLEDYGLLRFSIAFSVEGSYAQLRQFINFVEVSDHFLMLEDVRMNEVGEGDSTIRVQLRISSLFLRKSPRAAPEMSVQEKLST